MMERKTYYVLVIGDNKDDYALVEELLANQNDEFILLWAKNFEETQNILLSDQFRFDIILLDMKRSGNGGIPFINKVIDLNENIPIIILTNTEDIKFSNRSLAIGVSDYILNHDLTTMLRKSIIYSIERKKSALALKESERKYGELFHTSPLPMWVTNMETMQFVDVNEAMLAHYGYSREEFLTMTVNDVTVDGECLTKGEHEPDRNLEREVTHVKKNGELINVEIQTAQIFYKGVKSAIVIAKDVTEKMNYIKAVEKQNKLLLEISWIQSHLVRAPLTRIIGLIPLIESAIDLATDEETKKMLRYIAFSANELDTIIMSITKKTEVTDNYDVTKMKSNVVLKRVS